MRSELVLDRAALCAHLVQHAIEILNVQVQVDAPVKSLVPDVAFTNKWEATDPVRVVHLLEHTTGWDDVHPKEMAHDDPRPVTLAEGLAVGPESRTSRWRPGTFYSYSNSGPAVAAAVVEKLTGKRFEDYVQESFFDRIGMPTADYFDSRRAVRSVCGHTRQRHRHLEQVPLARAGGPDRWPQRRSDVDERGGLALKRGRRRSPQGRLLGRSCA